MDDLLLNRLEAAVKGVLEKNRQLEAESAALRQEKAAWQQERGRLLEEVERILKRIDSLPLEDS